MVDNESTEDMLLTLTADIVAAHVSNNSVAVNDLPTLIQNVHAALNGISGKASAPEPKTKRKARKPFCKNEPRNSKDAELKQMRKQL